MQKRLFGRFGQGVFKSANVPEICCYGKHLALKHKGGGYEDVQKGAEHYGIHYYSDSAHCRVFTGKVQNRGKCQ